MSAITITRREPVEFRPVRPPAGNGQPRRESFLERAREFWGRLQGIAFALWARIFRGRWPY